MGGTPPVDVKAELAELRTRAETPDPGVRAAIADRLRQLLEHDFEATFDATQSWVFDRSERVQAVACRGMMIRLADPDDVQVRRLIGRAEHFVGDPRRPIASTVCREVLPYLLGIHPRLMSEWVRSWIENSEELVRVDVATVLAGLASRFPSESVDGLSVFYVDPRPVVQAGVKAAIAEVARRNPAMSDYLRSRFPLAF